MSEKQRFNKDIQNRQIAEKRRERWMSRKILTEILETIRLQKNDANWVLYQVFKKENLTYKSKIKIWNHLMRAGYDLAQEKPQKTKKIPTMYIPGTLFSMPDETPEIKDDSKIFSYKEAWQEYKTDKKVCKDLLEANQKLYQQLEEANEVIKKVADSRTGTAGKQWCPEFQYLEKYNISRWDE